MSHPFTDEFAMWLQICGRSTHSLWIQLIHIYLIKFWWICWFKHSQVAQEQYTQLSYVSPITLNLVFCWIWLQYELQPLQHEPFIHPRIILAFIFQIFGECWKLLLITPFPLTFKNQHWFQKIIWSDHKWTACQVISSLAPNFHPLFQVFLWPGKWSKFETDPCWSRILDHVEDKTELVTPT